MWSANVWICVRISECLNFISNLRTVHILSEFYHSHATYGINQCLFPISFFSCPFLRILMRAIHQIPRMISFYTNNYFPSQQSEVKNKVRSGNNRTTDKSNGDIQTSEIFQKKITGAVWMKKKKTDKSERNHKVLMITLNSIEIRNSLSWDPGAH